LLEGVLRAASLLAQDGKPLRRAGLMAPEQIING
jgi:hypothetical protein